MKFTFMVQDESDWNKTKRTVEFEAVQLDDIVSEFELFLKGSGFHFDNILIHENDDDGVEDDNFWGEDDNFFAKVPEDKSLDDLREPLSDLTEKEKLEAAKNSPRYYGLQKEHQGLYKNPEGSTKHLPKYYGMLVTEC